MNTPQFLMEVYNWLMASPANIVCAASVLAAVTPTPNPDTPFGKVYRLLELFAFNFLHAKDTGVTAAQALSQVQQILEKNSVPKDPQ